MVIEATQWFKIGDHPNDFDQEKLGFENGEMRTWTGAEVKANGWEGQIVRYYRNPSDDGQRKCGAVFVGDEPKPDGVGCGCKMHDHGWIDTLEGGHIVCPGDWIITGVKGERYPCKPDIFAARYEAI